MQVETVLANARLVLPDRVMHGHVVVQGGRIREIGEGRANGEDMEGEFLLPGFVELHTDHLERHLMPRPKVQWDATAALQAHDAQVAASGVTTVFDALRIGFGDDDAMTVDLVRHLADAIEMATEEGRLRAEHFVHLRAEVSMEDAVAGFEVMAGRPRVRLASLMDHAPGQRQFTDLATYRVYHQAKMKLSDAEFEQFCARRVADSQRFAPAARTRIAALSRENAIVLASHDDATEAHVAEAVELGIALAEFPTTLEAARASHAAGLGVLMGAPNLVRGGSHSGNVSALALHEAGLLDVLSSDYVPFSLMQALFALAGEEEARLPAAVRLVSRTPAEIVGLLDRGAIEPGLRADLVRVRPAGVRPPVVRSVWREGRRIA